jgi:hypothetical protein
MLRIVLGTALGMDVAVITTSLTLAETVPALADQRDRSATSSPRRTGRRPSSRPGWAPPDLRRC